MIMLPERIRRTLEKIVKEMRVAENVYGVGLFGSWSRGDAEASSDIDLLILDKNNFNYEYVERVETGSLLIDLDHVPKQWIQGPIPIEIDQKLYELQIFYDRDWTLSNTKLLMAKSFASPERIDIRTEAHVVESDIYLSRATSAFSRGDYYSAYLFATVALENIFKVLVEATLTPFSNSHFIEKLEFSAAKLGMQDLFKDYLDITRLNKIDNDVVKDKLKLFKAIWDEIKAISVQHQKVFEASHFKVKVKLNYYLNPAFLKGTLMRADSLLNAGKSVEASHYLTTIFLDLIENYVWLKSSINKVKIDYTTLMRSLEGLEQNNARMYKQTTSFLSLDNIQKTDATNAIKNTREMMLKIREKRKVLIKNP